MARYRDPSTGRFTSRQQYSRSVDRVMRRLADAINRDDDRVATKLRDKLTKYPPLARKTSRRQAPPVPRPAPPPRAPRAPKASQWEFGKSYKSPRRGKHDVNINVRLTFDRPVSAREAKAAMAGYINGGEPDGVSVDAVTWNRPNGSVRSGSERDFDNFRSIFYTEGVDFLRAGAVKDDVL